MLNLTGHAILITGSTKGVGRAIAEACAQAGARVVLHGRSFTEEARAAVDRCRELGPGASFVTADLSEDVPAAVEHLFASALAAEPGLDGLVNNAGQYFDVPFEEMTFERFERTMRLNVTSGYFLTQRFARHWIGAGTSGRVLFIGSINGRRAEPVSTAYDISKGAVEMMVRTLAVALAPRNIRVNGLSPGLVRTPQTAWLDQRPELAAWITHHTPNGQIPPATVCGPGAVYLLSDAADHVHGHILTIDGGLSAWQYPLPP